MKTIAVWSDTHLGKRMYRTDEDNVNKFEQIGYRIADEYSDMMIAENPDLIIHCGDFFDKHDPSILAITKYRAIQKKFQQANIPTMSILGNHDFNIPNRKNNCSAPEMCMNTYFADYDLRVEVIDNILFVMMPYIYDTDENIQEYMRRVEKIVEDSTENYDCKILITHGVTEKYSKESFISDPILLSDYLVSLFDFVLIGHIHTPFEYKQGNTWVISPGGMIDYQANVDRTGFVLLDPNKKTFKRRQVITPHIIKEECTEENINSVLESVTENIYHIHYTGNSDAIDNDLFISAQNTAINVVIDIAREEVEEVDEEKSTVCLDIYAYVNSKFPEHNPSFETAKEALVR